jgi:hypothetical protein
MMKTNKNGTFNLFNHTNTTSNDLSDTAINSLLKMGKFQFILHVAANTNVLELALKSSKLFVRFDDDTVTSIALENSKACNILLASGRFNKGAVHATLLSYQQYYQGLKSLSESFLKRP